MVMQDVKKIYIILSFLCFSFAGAASNDIFPGKPLFKKISIDPMSPNSSFGYGFQEKHIIGNIGTTMTMLRFGMKGGVFLDIGVEAALYMLLLNKPDNYPIFTLDFLISIPIDVTIKDWFILRTKYKHISGHLSDESVGKYEDAVGYSRDTIDLIFDVHMGKTKSARLTLENSIPVRVFPNAKFYNFSAGLEYYFNFIEISDHI